MFKAEYTKDDYLRFLKRKGFRKQLIRSMKHAQRTKTKRYATIPLALKEALAEYNKNYDRPELTASGCKEKSSPCGELRDKSDDQSDPLQ